MQSKLIFFGDSITAGNKTFDDLLGVGYVSMFAKMARDSALLKDLTIINAGINGHTIQDLLGRHDRDVIQHDPELLMIMIGINDAYQDFMSGERPQRLEMYEEDYRKLLTLLKSEMPNCRLFLATPYFIADDRNEGLYQLMSRYCQIVKGLGEGFGLPVLDIQAVFDKAVLQRPALAWAADQIHPISEGHHLIAEHVFRFLEDNLN